MLGRLIAAFVIEVMLTATSSHLDGAQPNQTKEPSSRNGKPVRIATVKLAVILEEVTKLDRTKLQREAEELERRYNEETAEVIEKVKRLDKMERGPEYDKLEEEIVAFRARGEVMPTKPTFIQREAAIYAKDYREVQEEIAAYCTAKRIDVVLNDDFPEYAATEESPDPITRNISKFLVLAGPGSDITPEILRRIRERRAQQKKTVLTGAASNSSTK